MPNPNAMIAIGALALLAGVLALAFPLPASLTVNAFVGAGLLLAGLFGALGAARLAAGPERTWGVLLGLAMLALGAILLVRPVEGLQTLTIAFAVAFLFSGLVKLWLGWQVPVLAWRWALILSGAVSVGLALIIFTGMPEAAAVVPGLLLAVELLSYGWGLVFLGLAWRRRQG